MSKILMVSSEATPFSKTGGLADVVGALAPKLQARGEQVAVLTPRYRGIPIQGLPRVYSDLGVWFGPRSYYSHVYRAVEHGVPYYLLDCPALYDREGLYTGADYPDNYFRFAVLARAALTLVRDVFRPQVIHCHDWQAALAPIYMHTLLAYDPSFLGLKTVLTIHNLGYQGLFERSVLGEIGLSPSPELEFWGQANLLKGAMLYADALTTVSRKYAEEIQRPELGFGLDGVLRDRSDALTGILNGADYAHWDPRDDRFLAATYGPEDLAGKQACKADLLDAFGLPRENLERPLIGVVSRLIGQKGFDLVEQIAPELMEEEICLAVLGTGDARYEHFFRTLAAARPNKFAARLEFDNALAHKVEAGADLFLMPSRYEPCGLNQIYSLRYGAVPIVRATGGLDDTIDGETGFKFHEYTGEALLRAIRSAVSAYRDRARWQALMLAGMRKDFSWDGPAAQYSALYRGLCQ